MWPMEFLLWRCAVCREPVEWVSASYDVAEGKLVGVLHKGCADVEVVSSPDPHPKL